MNKDNTRSNENRKRSSDFKARGEPALWLLGGTLTIGLLMIFGFLTLIIYNGLSTFYPRPIEVLRLTDGSKIAGEFIRSEKYKPEPDKIASLPEAANKELADNKGYLKRLLFKIGNFDLYHEDYKWAPDFEIVERSRPEDMIYVKRIEWGPFIGKIVSLDMDGNTTGVSNLSSAELKDAHREAEKRRRRIQEIERGQLASVNYYMDRNRLALRKVELKQGKESQAYVNALEKFKTEQEKLEKRYNELSNEAASLRQVDSKYIITLADVAGKEKTIKISDIVEFYPSNQLSLGQKIKIYLAGWSEFLTEEPREANTEGGVLPAIFGTFCMTVLMSIFVAPFGVVAALYLREYAKQGQLVSVIRICVNNLAGVPSIVYGVFGLGFFAYVFGVSIDELFFPERFPNPTFGTGGILWASLTLALLTVPVVIVATEEALAAVPQSMREGSLACGASKWQTIKRIVLPRAMPGVMTGLILAMARGAGEVAPLMLVGVVKMAPELPIDSFYPYVHLERSFMHLGFHIFDLAFQSRNSEAAIPMVFVTTLLLITLVFVMNIVSIIVRNRLKRKFFAGHF